MRKEQFANNYCYHIYNRGVDKRQIFMDKEDYFRFLHDLFEFNSKAYSPPFIYRNCGRTIGHLVSNSKNNKKKKSEEEKLVEIYCFCLMPNHWHLLLRQLKDNGVSLFLQKVTMGYSKYFNGKYERNGTLFQGPFRARLINNDAYLTHLSRYIHLNPLDLKEPAWREKGVRNLKQTQNFLKSYKWSSFLDYIGIKNYSSLIKKDFLLSMFKNEKDYEKFVNSWVVDDLERVQDYIIEIE